MERKPASERLEFAIVYFKINSPEDNAVLSDLMGLLLKEHDLIYEVTTLFGSLHFQTYSSGVAQDKSIFRMDFVNQNSLPLKPGMGHLDSILLSRSAHG